MPEPTAGGTEVFSGMAGQQLSRLSKLLDTGKAAAEDQNGPRLMYSSVQYSS